jgi:hypothetical protein
MIVTRAENGLRIGKTALEIRRGVYHAQAKGCWGYLQIGMLAFFIGWSLDRRRTAWRLELFKPGAKRVQFARPVEVDAMWRRVRNPVAHPGQSLTEVGIFLCLVLVGIGVLIYLTTR